MSASYDAPGSCHSQETRFTPTAPVKPTQTSPQAFPLAYQKRYIWPPARTVFEAYKFYRAGATWEYAERTELYFERKELCEMINLRAEESTVECQYQNLSPNQRAQVSRLVQDRQAEYSGMVWSYVYAKENYYANVTRNPRSENFEAISMVIVLMGRPMESTKYPRTRMGVYVDLRTLRSPHEGAINNMRPFGVTPHWGHSEIHPAGYYGAQGRHSTSTPMERYPSPGSDSGPVVAEFSTRLDSSLLPVYVK
ncbi:uncharacterized protein N7511_004350 [Penicillium nucicola]|uniref:uncharacterized protein n=1 Tax=Penicillium nucicola TaxID=1850975 RepID=UPI002544E0F9|nr:uncharacterized protein N7511_004350 [Penicillium nucicola]KAJ5766734.1 hypothetical protein N7511_004350 [Penicillium nucicola]